MRYRAEKLVGFAVAEKLYRQIYGQNTYICLWGIARYEGLDSLRVDHAIFRAVVVCEHICNRESGRAVGDVYL